MLSADFRSRLFTDPQIPPLSLEGSVQGSACMAISVRIVCSLVGAMRTSAVPPLRGEGGWGGGRPLHPPEGISPWEIFSQVPYLASFTGAERGGWKQVCSPDLLGPLPPSCRALFPSGAMTESCFLDWRCFACLWLWLALIKVDSSGGSRQLALIVFFSLVFGLSGGRGVCFEWVLENFLVGSVWRLGKGGGGAGVVLLGASFSFLVGLFGGVWVDGVGGRSRAWVSGVVLCSSVTAGFRWALGFPRVRRGAGFIRIVRSWLRGGQKPCTGD